MPVYHSLSDYQSISSDTVLTLGNFDGVHLGHRALTDRLCAVAKEKNATSVVLTFQQHPASVLSPESVPPALCSLPHKLQLLQSTGVDTVLAIEFTRAFSEQTTHEFLSGLRSVIPFSHLVLGYDARFGRDRDGTPATVEQAASQLGFSFEYIEQVFIGDSPASSTAIRALISTGDLDAASHLLGRRYSIRDRVVAGHGLGRGFGAATANLEVTGLCLPPYGVYAVMASIDNGDCRPGVANLGVAPAVRDEGAPLLEVHLFDHQEDLYGHTLDVELVEFIRPEQAFDTRDALSTQIQADIARAQMILASEKR